MRIQYGSKHYETNLTTVINEASIVAEHCRVNDEIIVDPKEVRGANSHLYVLLLEDIGDGSPNHLSHILNHQFVGRDGLQSE